ncbi:MAG: GNAT family N-acetyltransferase [Clostridia bacterium]|nr:GNAT family N-acetyltransferase [Clostridia bacterium]
MRNLTIRKATYTDLPALMSIYDHARAYMRENGNMEQWDGGYPQVTVIEEDISLGRCHICMDGDEIAGVFCFFKGTDPTYTKIYEGAWLNDQPYGVIHRIAVAKHGVGVASFCFDYALGACGNLKIDTHRDNIPMQNALVKNGFTRCGIIYLQSGDPRIAYQKSLTTEGK